MKFLVIMALFGLIAVAYAQEGADVTLEPTEPAAAGQTDPVPVEDTTPHTPSKDGKKKCRMICPKRSKLNKENCQCVCKNGFKAEHQKCRRCPNKGQSCGEQKITHHCKTKCPKGRKLAIAHCKCVKPKRRNNH